MKKQIKNLLNAQDEASKFNAKYKGKERNKELAKLRDKIWRENVEYMKSGNFN